MEYYIYVRGKKIPVNSSVYKGYWSDIFRKCDKIENVNSIPRHTSPFY